MDEHAELKKLIEETRDLAKENQRMLKKLYRASIAGTVLTVVWYALLVGVPFALYFYVLQPYIAQLQLSYGDLIEHFKTFFESSRQ